VGKSSLINRFLGEDRVLVSDIPGTTRDAIDIPFRITAAGQTLPATLIDTAGLRRRTHVDTAVEFFSVKRAEAAIRRCDVVLFVIDATAPGTAQDRRIARLIVDTAKPCIVAVNKWDLVSGSVPQKQLRSVCREMLPFMQHAPILFVCARSGYNLDAVIEQLLAVRKQMQVKVPTAILNQFMHDLVLRHPPPAAGNRRFKLFYATMTGNPPPRFLLFVNDRRACPANYRQFIENRLREAFFPGAGLPIQVELRQRTRELSETAGTRRAAAGVAQKRHEQRRAKDRHRARQKGWRQR
jgi:GTP-binding protein